MESYMSQHIMGILIASTAFAGLSGVVMGQMTGKWPIRAKLRARSGILLSICLSVFCILSTLAWFWTAEIAPTSSSLLIIPWIANIFFIAQLISFWYGAINCWVRE